MATFKEQERVLAELQRCFQDAMDIVEELRALGVPYEDDGLRKITFSSLELRGLVADVRLKLKERDQFISDPNRSTGLG